VGFTGSGGAGLFVRKTANYTAAAGEGIIADTSGGSWTLTLPATPSVGNIVTVVDGASWQTNNLTIARNGQTIEDTADDLLVDIPAIRLDLIYDGTTWEVYASTGQSGASGYSGYSGYSGRSGYSGYSGRSGYSGFSGYSGYSGRSGYSGYSGSSVTVTDNTSTNANTYYPLMANNQTTGTVTSATVSSTKFYFNPSTGQLNVTEINSLSDIALKNSIVTLNDGLGIINKINPVEFVWKDSGVKSYGVIAQEIEQLLPDIVTSAQDQKSVGYTRLIPFLIKAVQELQQEILELKGKK